MRGRDANPAVKDREAVRHVLEKSRASSCGDCTSNSPQASTTNQLQLNTTTHPSRNWTNLFAIADADGNSTGQRGMTRGYHVP